MNIDSWPMKTSAEFSWDRTYRYTLTRRFDDSIWNRAGAHYGSPAVFIMLNPSTADEKVADPTVRRCMQYARDWGCTELHVLNIFALRSTDPKALYTHPDPIGTENDYWIQKTLNRLDNSHFMGEYRVPMIVCAWGEHGAYKDRGKKVIDLLRDLRHQPLYLKLNSSGQPAHPLYLPKDLEPKPFV